MKRVQTENFLDGRNDMETNKMDWKGIKCSQCRELVCEGCGSCDCGEWTSIEERLPANFERVLFCRGKQMWTGFIQITEREPGIVIWWSANPGNLKPNAPFLCQVPTHWMTLSVPPEG